MLKVTDVAKVLGSRRVLDGVNLTVSRGEVGVVLGENGGGKSTLLRIVCGVLMADRGEIEIDGVSMRRDETCAKANMGYVPDATDALPELLVREFIELVAALKRVAPPVFAPLTLGEIGSASPISAATQSEGGRAPSPLTPSPSQDEDWVERLGVASIWRQSVGGLSFGQRKRVCLLAALLGDPPLLVLDEPSNGLDPEGVELIADIVHERQRSDRATLLSTNDAAFAARIGATRYRLARGVLAPDRLGSRSTEE